MQIESNPQNRFTIQLPKTSLLGFHGTSSLASTQIEAAGFLPNKVLPEAQHNEILQLAWRLGINTHDYKQWLNMQSVTFSAFDIALAHVKSGNSGGQGLMHVFWTLQKIQKTGTPADVSFASSLLSQLDSIRAAPSVVYAVDLSGFGQRLAFDGALHQYYWPSLPLPTISDIGPNRILARLDVST